MSFIVVLQGMAASIACLLFLYLLGTVSFPRRLFEKMHDTAIPFFYGAALFSLTGWYCIKFNVSLDAFFKGLGVYILVLGVIRFKQIAACQKILNQQTASWLGIYIFLYVLVAILIPEPMASNKLPITTFGNHDLFSYMNYAQYLIHLSGLNIAGVVSQVHEGSYYQTPVDFYFMALLSVFYRYKVIMAAMPVIYTCMALIGLMIVRYCRTVFQLPYLLSIAIAAVVLSGRFYVYIGGQYFLSTLMSAIPLLALLTNTVLFDFTDISYDNVKSFLMKMLPYYVLMFFTYTAIFCSALFVQLALIGLILLFSVHFLEVIKKGLVWGGILCALFILVLGLEPFHAKEMMGLFFEYIRVTGNGWPLHWISPFVMLGFPVGMETSSIVWQVIGLMLFVIMLMSILKALKKSSSNNIKAFFFLTLLVFIIYNVYFYWSETQYQPWKFASYYVLPLSGVIWATIAWLLRFEKHWKTGLRHVFLGMLVLLTLDNIFHAYRHYHNLQTWSAKYHDLALLNTMPFSSVWIKMDSYAATFLAPYFIPDKKLYLLSDSYYLKTVLDPNKVSYDSPLFIAMPIKKCRHLSPDEGMIIGQVGCLYFKMPREL